MSSHSFTNPVDDESVPKVDNAIAVGEDLHFQENWWRFERIAWAVIAVVLLADVLGVFGRGWLSKAELHTPGSGMDVKYERVERAGTPSMLSLQLHPDLADHGAIQLFVSTSLLQDLGNQRIIPQPLNSVIGNNGVTYTFQVSGQEPMAVDFEMQPSFPGLHRFTLQVPGHTATGAQVLVLP